jgi:UDP-2,3-diacylglucosamine pyrophosphatase LpxH
MYLSQRDTENLFLNCNFDLTVINKNKVENKDQNVYNEENVLVYLAMRKDIVYNSGQRIGDLV